MIFLFFIFLFTNIKWIMLTQGFQKFYGSITEALRKNIGLDFILFFSSFSPILSEICLFRVMGVLWKNYGSLGSHFSTKGGRCLPPSSPRWASCLARKKEKVQNPLDGPRFEIFYLLPHFTKYTPFCVFLPISFRNLPKLYGFQDDGCFSFEKLWNFMDYATMLAFPFGMLRNFMDYATMLVLRVLKGTNKVRKSTTSVPGWN